MGSRGFVILMYCAWGLLLFPIAAGSQGMPQVFPSFPVHAWSAIARWNGDTVFVAGNNNGFMRSTDAGLNWTPVLNTFTGHDYNFVGMGVNADGVWLLPAPTYFTRSDFADTTTMLLLRYSPGTNGITEVRLPARISAFSSLTKRSISVCRGGVYALQYRESPRASALQFSGDRGITWRDVPIPDASVYAVSFCDSLRGFCVGYRTDTAKYRRLYSTLDGGAHWTPVQGFPFSPATSANYNELSRGFASQWVDDTTFAFRGNDYAIHVTTDFGGTWRSVQAFIDYKNEFALSPDGACFVTTIGLNIMKSPDDGATWTVINEGISTYGTCLPYILALSRDTGIFVTTNGFLIRTTDGGVTWDRPFYGEICLNKTQFIDRSTAIAEGNTLDGSWGRMYTTTDAGSTWTERFDAVAIHWGTVCAVNTRQFWAVLGFPDILDTSVYLSMDGGLTWSAKYLGSVNGKVEIEELTDGKWACGEDTLALFSDAGLLRTFDRGEHWTFLPQMWNYLAGSDAGRGFTIYFNHPESQWVRSYSRIIRTTDFGDTWIDRSPVTDTVAYSLRYLDMKVVDVADVFVTAEVKELATSARSFLVYHTTDDGASWQSWVNPAGSNMQNTFANGVGYQISRWSNGMSANDNLVKTTDGWKTASVIAVLGSDGGKLMFIDSDHGWYISYSAVYRTTNGGVNWIEMPRVYPRDIALEQNHPNPVTAGAGTAIAFTVTGNRALPVTLDVFDCLGRRVREQYSATVAPGRHEIRWDTRGAAPGMYVIRLISGDQSDVRKMIVR